MKATMNEQISLNGVPIIGFGATDTTSGARRVVSFLAVPATGAAIGGLIGYGIKKNAHGATVGALVGGAAPFVLAAALVASGWTP